MTNNPFSGPQIGGFNDPFSSPFSSPFTGGDGGGLDGSTPGSTICGLLGLQGGCSWAQAIAAGYNTLFGGSETPSGEAQVPSGNNLVPGGNGNGDCPGLFSVRVGNQCVNVMDALPGGDPLTTPLAGFQPTAGWYGVGLTPQSETITRRKCPPGFALGKDGICYQGLARTKREHDPGRKPLLTGGEMAAIAKAKRAAGRLSRTQKSIKKTARALEKAC